MIHEKETGHSGDGAPLSPSTDGAANLSSNPAISDEPDTGPFGHEGSSSSKTGTAGKSASNNIGEPWVPVIPHKLDCYPMERKIHGWAVIFYFENFEAKLGLERREEVKKDVENLRSIFTKRGFHVKEHPDLTRSAIIKELDSIAVSEELKNLECLVVFFLSHGRKDYLYVKDDEFEEEKLWSQFYKCEALFGKPKLFFIQVAWKSKKLGSYFIYTLCKVMEKHSQDMDVVKMLTMVAQIVAFQFKTQHKEPHNNEKKQMPTIRSTLTREVYLRPKP
ncbi:unnamed protein product [Darwinula stevensoni]|uniref:Uncharacterized protein n=1 Tax=Darwinula stevensoni TaxID=69355 RepID=A0A7R9A588_9CRUS|nr:unnamed protein product [Darwinula stevensoni]CAG0893900.1 unnamed protein product [Darwinula stevensoni]